MKRSYVNRFLFLLTFLGGCVEDADLHRSIFIRDKQYPDLPQYSEWGYNTFGAYLNDDVFVSTDKLWDPASLLPNDSAMILTFHGEKRSKGMDSTDMIMTFIIPRKSPRDAQYLLALNNTVIDLRASSAGIVITSDSIVYPITINDGEFHFIRVQNLMVDNFYKETILSGTFEFEGIMDGKPLRVTLGRFDVGVNYY